MLLVVDNGSVFTPNILDTLSKKNIKFSLVSFQKINELDWKKFNSFILSGRRKNEKKMNAINSEIINHVVSEKKSLLGICYGAEILALTLGGTIRKSDDIVSGIHIVNITAQNTLYKKDLEVYQSHSYEIAKLGTHLQSFASSKTCSFEIIKHKRLQIFGTQFHPEMSNDGQLLIQSFLKIIH
jgi:GMP synthase (glutamine-hydrolysing)